MLERLGAHVDSACRLVEHPPRQLRCSHLATPPSAGCARPVAGRPARRRPGVMRTPRRNGPDAAPAPPPGLTKPASRWRVGARLSSRVRIVQARPWRPCVLGQTDPVPMPARGVRMERPPVQLAVPASARRRRRMRPGRLGPPCPDHARPPDASPPHLEGERRRTLGGASAPRTTMAYGGPIGPASGNSPSRRRRPESDQFVAATRSMVVAPTAAPSSRTSTRSRPAKTSSRRWLM